jgi:hypothetical protein
VLWPKVGLRGGTCPTTRASFVAGPTLGNGYPVRRPSLTCWQSGISKGANTWPSGEGGGAGQPQFRSVGPRLCATSSPHVRFSPIMPYFGHIEDMNRFWSIWCFSIIRCSSNGRSTKLVELVSNKHLSSILLALIKRRFHVPTCRVNVWNNHVFTLSTNLVPQF